ncbi:MAG: ParB/RepB/Spo0J family partition protein [Deltaproteobacteria bacterium]|nr:ParB/RepB/Spo0J family partition protein [Deltaproteobacteria bacterium]
MTTNRRRALGRGLAALIPGAAAPPPPPVAGLGRDYFLCPIEDVARAPAQPRQTFDEGSLGELAASIREQGVIQPLIVRQRDGGGYLIIAGERRWRAAQRAGLRQIPVIVKEATPAQSFELALVENLQRDDLNPIEEAEAYRRLSEEFGYTQEQLAQRVGKERSSVTNSLRLLKLPEAVRGMCASGQLSMGHARALLGGESEAAILRLARAVVARGLSVRQTEEAVRRQRAGDGRRKAKGGKGPEPSASVRDLESRLRRALGTRVKVVQRSAQAGHLQIDYASLDELDRLLERLLRT